MNLKRVTNAKLIVVLRKKKHVRYLICAKFVNRIGSALYNLALLTLAAKQTYSTLAIALVKLFENLPGFFDPILAYLTDRETRRLKKAAWLNLFQVLIYFMIAFLMIISLIVIAVFLYIITIQKLPNYAVLRVQGIANKVLIQNTIGQSFILVITGLIIGALLTLATALVIPTNVPMTFDLKFLSLVSVGLMLTSVLGSLIPVRAILRIDPAQAIGG